MAGSMLFGFIFWHLSWTFSVALPTDLITQSTAEADLSNHIPLGTDQRPFYNIAHMCNSIKKTISSLERGANAVEVDVTFKPDDIYLYHGYPCDCFRYCWDMERLDRFLIFARKITTPGNPRYQPRFVILYFDLKISSLNDPGVKYYQGGRFADYIVKYFFSELPTKSTLRLVLSISYVNDADFLLAFIRRLKELNLFETLYDRIGYDVGMDSDLENIQAMWTRLNVSNVWQGEGITNCFNPILSHQLAKLVEARDINSYFRKVYRWTIDLSDSIRSVLRYDIDGIMTNHPERIVQIITEDPDFSRSYRIATIHDNPFSRMLSRSSADWPPQATNRAGSTKVRSFFQDLKDSIFHFFYEIYLSFH